MPPNRQRERDQPSDLSVGVLRPWNFNNLHRRWASSIAIDQPVQFGLGDHCEDCCRRIAARHCKLASLLQLKSKSLNRYQGADRRG